MSPLLYLILILFLKYIIDLGAVKTVVREATFIRRNQTRWQEYENLLGTRQTISPDKYAEIFIELTDDLSFARTQYNTSRTVKYLNTLTSKIHLEIYRNKRENGNRFIMFWKYDVPYAVYEARWPLFYTFLVFTIAGLIGAVSGMNDETFVRLILGDGYVNMTLENIKEGNPTGVYGTMDSTDMFWRIAINNIWVSFRVFVLGILTSITTLFMLFYEGIRLGAFFTMFYKEDVLGLAAPVVMLHGTIELSSIIVAGAAGVYMGNGILFPKSYSRLESFKKTAKVGMKMVMGLVPFFLVAAIIESYVTRHSGMADSIKYGIILISAIVMVSYFIVYPFWLQRAWRIRS